MDKDNRKSEKWILSGCDMSHHDVQVHHNVCRLTAAANSFSAIASRIDVLSVNSDMWIPICWIEKECYLADASNQYIRTGIHLCVKLFRCPRSLRTLCKCFISAFFSFNFSVVHRFYWYVLCYSKFNCLWIR